MSRDWARLELGDAVHAQVVNIRVAALGALEQINDMLEQVKADHGEARLAVVDADLARAGYLSHGIGASAGVRQAN